MLELTNKILELVDQHLPVVVIVGPTAIGKTNYAIHVAEELSNRNIRSEIVNADAFSLYKYMDIGTSKPTKLQQKKIKHSQIDIALPNENISVAQYQKSARDDIKNILSNKKIPIVVGGSGLYIRSLIYDINFPPQNEKIRQKYQNYFEEFGVEKLYKLLCERDYRASLDIQPNNSRRIIRALEVIEITGKPFVAKTPKDLSYFYKNTFQLGLKTDLMTLDKHVEDRTKKMIDEGLVSEVLNIKKNTGFSITARKAIGYREILDYFENNCVNDLNIKKDEIDNIISLISLHTKQLIRKQISWFNSDKNIYWSKHI